MSLIKGRNWTKKEDEELLIVLNELQEKKTKVTWNYIARLIKQRNPQSRKNGKQCRERWANQLDPEIKRNENWTKEQDETLFRLHNQLGNRWSEICSHLKGRTDNCIKNHFYSTLRRGFRKLNSYIENIKRKTTLSKVIKNQILNKILALCQGKKDAKFLFNEKAKTLALEIKSKLVILSLELSELDEENISFKDEIYSQMLEFSRNCKKRKTKKTSQFSDQSDSQLSKMAQRQIIKANEKSDSCKEIKESKPDKPQDEQNIKIIKSSKTKGNKFKRKISVLEKSYQSHILGPQREDILKLIHKKNILKQQLEGKDPINMKIQEKQKRKQDKKANETGFFEFIRPQDDEQIQQKQKNQQKSSVNFSKLVTSQEFQDYQEFKQNFGFPFSFVTSDNLISANDENPNIPFSSPLYSPFSFCRPPMWVAAKEQMFRSTRFQQSNFSQKEEQESRKKESAFKLIKRQCVVDIIKPPTE